MTPYTGDPDSTQAPSGPPDGGAPPILNLPDDSDPPNGATFAQAYKVVADFIAWLLAPFAKIAAWTQAVVVWANALKQPITGIDHFGMLRESTYGWTENWDNSGQYSYGAGPGNRAIGTRWHQELGGATGSIDAPPPGAGFVAGNPFVQQRAIRFTNGTVANDFISMNVDPNSAGLIFTDDTVVSVDFPAFVDGFANITYSFGLMGSGLAPDLGNGAYFYKDGTLPQWQCKTALAASTHSVSSGITVVANTVYRFRIVLIGANRDDSSTARALFFINEALVGNIILDLPINVDVVPAFYVNPNAGAAAHEFAFGAVRYKQTIYPGGVF